MIEHNKNLVVANKKTGKADKTQHLDNCRQHNLLKNYMFYQVFYLFSMKTCSKCCVLSVFPIVFVRNQVFSLCLISFSSSSRFSELWDSSLLMFLSNFGKSHSSENLEKLEKLIKHNEKTWFQTKKFEKLIKNSILNKFSLKK